MKSGLTEFSPSNWFLRMSVEVSRSSSQELCIDLEYERFPQGNATMEAGRHKRVSTGNSGPGWPTVVPCDTIPVALVPKASCPQLQSGNY